MNSFELEAPPPATAPYTAVSASAWGFTARPERILLVTATHDRTAPDSAAPALRALGCEVHCQTLGSVRGIEWALRAQPSLILVDAREGLDGVHLSLPALRELAPLHEVPVLLLVTQAQLATCDPRALADDFIVAPLSAAELQRRLQRLCARGDDAPSLAVGGLHIDLDGHTVSIHGRRLQLTLQEFKLLKVLVQNRGRALTREQLFARGWGQLALGCTRTVDIHVRRLRAKLGSADAALIETVRGVGYRVSA